MALDKSKYLILGTDEDFLDHEMDVGLREEHMHVIGSPGQGKSRFILSLIMQDIKYRRGVCLIDPHGELVDHVKDWISENELISSRRKIHILDFSDFDTTFCFDPLHVKDERQIEAVVERAVVALATANSDDDIQSTPLLESTLMGISTALAYAGLAYTEAQFLTSPYFPEERLAITSKIRNREVARSWEAWNAMAVKNPRAYLDEFRAADRRIMSLLRSSLVKSIVGQKNKHLNLMQAMDESHIILLDLSQKGGYTPPQSANLLGRLFLSSLVGTALQRAPRTSRPFNLYVDEAHAFLSGDIPTILAECRKFGLHLTLAHQFLGQLQHAGEKIYDGVMATARNKICFALDDPRDAEIMQRRIFAGHYDFERPKLSLNKPVVVGHEIIRLRSESAGKNQAESLSQHEAEGVSEGTAQGFSSSSASTISEAQTQSEALSKGRSSSTSHSQTDSIFGGTSHADATNSSLGTANSSVSSQSAGEGSSAGQGMNFTVNENGEPVSDLSGMTMNEGQSLSSSNTEAAGSTSMSSLGSSSVSGANSGAGSANTHGSTQGFSENQTVGSSRTKGLSSTSGYSESEQYSQSRSKSTGRSKAQMQGSSQSEGYSEALMPILEERVMSTYSLPELQHMFTDSILTLPKRNAFAIIAGEGMARIETLDVPDIKVSETRRNRVLREIIERSPIHQPTLAAEEEIEQRFQNFMTQKVNLSSSSSPEIEPP